MTDMAAKCTRGEDISEAAAVSLKGGLAFWEYSSHGDGMCTEVTQKTQMHRG